MNQPIEKNKPASPAATGNFSAIGQPPVAQLADHPTADVNWPRPVAKLPVTASSNAAVKGPPAVAQLPTESNAAQIWQRAVAKLTWAHNIMDKNPRLCYHAVSIPAKPLVQAKLKRGGFFIPATVMTP